MQFFICSAEQGALMKKTLHAMIMICLLSLGGAALAQDDDNAKSACEAVLCLSSGNRPDECAPSLSRYFSINFRKWSDTVRARQNFLNLCPIVSRDAALSVLASTISNESEHNEQQEK
jgi:TrbM